MKKVLFVLMVGVLFTGMIFAVDITEDLESSTSYSDEDALKVTFDPTSEDSQYIKVGFTSTEVKADSAIDSANIDIAGSTIEIAPNTNRAGYFDNASSPVYLYYQVRTTKDITLSIKTTDMTSVIDTGKTIPLFVGVTPEGTDDNTEKTVDSSASVAVLKFSPESTVKTAQESVALDIYTTFASIPDGVTANDYTGYIQLTVATSGE